MPDGGRFLCRGIPDGCRFLCHGAERVTGLAREKGATNASGLQVPTQAYVSTIQESCASLLNDRTVT
jgi:hypothetical protein